MADPVVDNGSGTDYTVSTKTLANGSEVQQIEVVTATEGGTATEFGTTANPVKVDGSNVTQPVSGTVTANIGTVGTLATAAKQDTGNASLSSIDGKITAVNTGAVVVSSSALPSGAATSAKQDTGNTSLSSIDGKITAVNTGAVVVSSSALPSGAATSAKQDTAQTALDAIKAAVETIDNFISGTTGVVVGNKTNNNAAPGATNVGVLPGVANAANPTITEGNQAALSQDLLGRLRVVAPDITSTGTMDAATEEVVLDLAGGGIPVLQLSGTFANGTTTLIFEGDPGNGTYVTIQALHLHSDTGTPVYRYVTGLTGGDTLFNDGCFKPLGISGFKRCKVRMPARGGADSVVATWYVGAAQPDVVLGALCGDIAHSGAEGTTAVNSPPVKTGGQAFFTGAAEAFTSLPSAVSSADRVNHSASAYGHTNVQIPNRYIQKTITANSVDRDFPLEGLQSFNLRTSGTFTGTIVFSFSADNGASFFAWTLFDTTTGESLATFSNTRTSNWKPVFASGFTHLRVSSIAWTSGTLTLDFNGSAAPLDVAVYNVIGNIPHDSADSYGPIKIGGKAIAEGVGTAVSAANDRVNALFDLYGRLVVKKSDTWTANHAPAAATQATIAKASAGSGVKNVCTSITCTLSSSAAPTAGRVIFNLRDGASGAGTILWTGALSLVAVAGEWATLVVDDLWIVGSSATAMTLESAAAPAANIFATVSMTGTITQ